MFIFKPACAAGLYGTQTVTARIGGETRNMVPWPLHSPFSANSVRNSAGSFKEGSPASAAHTFSRATRPICVTERGRTGHVGFAASFGKKTGDGFRSLNGTRSAVEFGGIFFTDDGLGSCLFICSDFLFCFVVVRPVPSVCVYSGYLRKRRSSPPVRMKESHSTWRTSTSKHWARPLKRSWSTWQVTNRENKAGYNKNKNGQTTLADSSRRRMTY